MTTEWIFEGRSVLNYSSLHLLSILLCHSSVWNPASFEKNFYQSIVDLQYVLIPGVQQSESVIYVPVSVLFQILFLYRLPQNMKKKLSVSAIQQSKWVIHHIYPLFCRLFPHIGHLSIE